MGFRRPGPRTPRCPTASAPVGDLNIDMIGRNDPNELFITPTREHKQFNPISEAAMRISPLEGFPKLGERRRLLVSRSDHANFSRNLDIPVAFLFADVHEDYHKVTDTPDKIDYDKIRRVSRLVVRMLDALQRGRAGRMSAARSKNRTRHRGSSSAAAAASARRAAWAAARRATGRR